MRGKALNRIAVRFALLSALLSFACIGSLLYFEAFVELHQLPVALLALLAAMAIGLPALVTFAAARKLTGQIAALRASTEAIASGEFGQLVDVDCACEIGGLADSFGKVVERLNSTIRQMAEQKETLTLEIEEHRRLLETSPDLIVITDRDRMIRRISQSCRAILGFETEEMVGHYGGDFLPDDKDLDRIRGIIGRSIMTSSSQTFQTNFLHKDGHRVPMEFNGTWSPLSERLYLIGRDMTQAVAAEKKLRQLAHFDQLTGLANRNTLISDLELRSEQSRLSGLTVAMIDLDGFKDINDALGHGAGDEVLRFIARRAVEATPGGKVYRLGGDEFVILFDDGDVVATVAAARKLVDKCEEGIEISGRQVYVGVSVGVCSAALAGSSIDELMYCADLALYHAKANGGRKISLFEPTMRSDARCRQELEKELRIAVAQQQFEVFYQPQVRTSDETIVGAEALLRWRHPTKGLLAPGTFIEVLTQSPMALGVGQWIIETACRDAARWSALGLTTLRVGVNLFPCQFKDRQLVSLVKAALQRNRLPPERLELEITEDIALERNDEALTLMKELRSLGVGLAFDDFGTGYASLSYLVRYPLNRLKIDRSFVSRLSEDVCGGERPIIRSLVTMAHGLGLEVIAEGVETRQQAQLIANKGCDEIQGYLYGKPMPFDEFVALAAKQGGAAHKERLIAV